MYDRRTFLRRAGLATAGTAVLAGLPRPAAAVDEDLAPFVHGVASGDPRPDGVILWTRVTVPDGSRVPVRWRVARDLAMTDVVADGLTITDADRDFTVKVDVDGLGPAQWYFYDFEARGVRSIIGRTKTAPAGGVDQLRFGVVSCSNYQGGFFNAYARLAERNDLDAIIHVGDYLYEYGNADGGYGPGAGELSEERNHQPDSETLTLSDYRLRHANYKLDPDLRRLHQLFPWVVTWDDHESANNSRRDSAQNHQAGEGSWEVRKAASQRAYAEWMPLRVDDPAVIYRTLRYGDLMELIVLDTRLEGRDDEVGTVGATIVSGAEIDHPDRQLISQPQRDMLNTALATDTTWKVIAQQVIVGQWNAGGLPRLPDELDSPQIVLRDGGNALNPDQWDGYTAERDRLFAKMRETSANVVVLTGDVHTSWALDLTQDPYNPLVYDPVTGQGAIGVEFVTPSVTSANFESLGPVGVAAAEMGTLADNPHVKWVDFDDHGYFVLDVTPERVQADWFFVDTVLTPDDGERHGGSWQVAVDEKHLEPASEEAPGGTPAAETPTALPPHLEVVGTASPTSPITAQASLGVAAAGLSLRLIDRRNRLSEPDQDG